MTFKIRHGSRKAAYHVTVGFYPPFRSGRIGEVFISTNQIGTESDAMARDLAVLLSLLLQFGCPVETIRDALTREANSAPSTIAGAVVDKLCQEARA